MEKGKINSNKSRFCFFFSFSFLNKQCKASTKETQHLSKHTHSVDVTSCQLEPLILSEQKQEAASHGCAVLITNVMLNVICVQLSPLAFMVYGSTRGRESSSVRVDKVK